MYFDGIGSCENDGDATASEASEQGNDIFVEKEPFSTEGFIKQDRAR